MGKAEPRPYHHGNLAAALVEAGLELAETGGPDAVVLREVARRVGVSPTAAYRHFENQAALNDSIKQASLGRLAVHMREALDRHDRDWAGRAAGDNAADGAANGAAGDGLVRGGAAGDGLVRGGAAGDGLVRGGAAETVQFTLHGVVPGSRAERAIRRLEAIGRAYFDFAVSQPGLFRCFCMGLPVPGPDAPLIQQLYGEEAFSLLGEVLDELVNTDVITAERRSNGVDIALWSAIHGLSVLCMDGPLAEIPRQAQEAMLTTVMDVLLHGLTGAADR